MLVAMPMTDLGHELARAADLFHRRALAAWEEATRAEDAVVQSAAAEHASAPHNYWKARHQAALRLEAATAVLVAIRDAGLTGSADIVHKHTEIQA